MACFRCSGLSFSHRDQGASGSRGLRIGGRRVRSRACPQALLEAPDCMAACHSSIRLRVAWVVSTRSARRSKLRPRCLRHCLMYVGPNGGSRLSSERTTAFSGSAACFLAMYTGCTAPKTGLYHLTYKILDLAVRPVYKPRLCTSRFSCPGTNSATKTWPQPSSGPASVSAAIGGVSSDRIGKRSKPFGLSPTTR